MIRQATAADTVTAAALALQLWPGHTADALVQEFSALLADPECAVFLAFCGDLPVGFAQCQLRHDYVEGTDSSPVGYLEGIYVTETARGKGVARQLLVECENWAKTQGCTEFASDCKLDNTASQRFHAHTGFQEANRIVCFTKKL